MTNIELKAQIDADITNKILPQTITNVEVGNDLKSLVDYTDQEISNINSSLSTVAVTGSYTDLVDLPNIEQNIKVLKTTITQSQILALNTTPVVILPDSGDVTKKRYPLSVLIRRNGSGTNYTCPSNLYVAGIVSGSVIQLSENVIKFTTFFSAGFSNQYYDYDTAFPNDYKLHSNVGDPTGGTGDIDVYVTYIEITL